MAFPLVGLESTMRVEDKMAFNLFLGGYMDLLNARVIHFPCIKKPNCYRELHLQYPVPYKEQQSTDYHIDRWKTVSSDCDGLTN